MTREQIRAAAQAGGIIEFMDALKERFNAKLIYFEAPGVQVGSASYKEGAVQWISAPNFRATRKEWQEIKEKCRRGSPPRKPHRAQPQPRAPT